MKTAPKTCADEGRQGILKAREVPASTAGSVAVRLGKVCIAAVKSGHIE